MLTLNKSPSSDAIRHVMHNRADIERSHRCGCIDCRKIFPASEVDEWIDDGKTAICPHCGTDALIGDAAGYKLTRQFLNELNKQWF